jgi:DNA-binding NtrC family response regulator
VQDLIQRAATSDVSILITGESGTGKELAAQSLHQASRRRNAPFVTIDCAAIPETLFESVLFGHMKGAFTGAAVNQPGLLRSADGGTVFLDEIGELPMTSQAKLLRLIQHGTFRPVGMTETISINVRFVAATNRNLEEEVRLNRFRQDLFYRLAVVPLVMPPLRDRGDDVLFLANYFLRRAVMASDRREFSDSAIQYLRTYSWPGNVRELKNVIDRAAVLSTGSAIDLTGPLPLGMSSMTQGALPAGIDRGSSREQALNQADRGYLEALLRANSGNVSQAAHDAGLTRQGLYKLLEKHGISPGDFRS